MPSLATHTAFLATHGKHWWWFALWIAVVVNSASPIRVVNMSLDEAATILCNTTDPNMIPHYVVWHKGHQRISGKRVFVNTKTGSLNFEKVQLGDEGNYTCSAVWGQRFTPFHITLLVSSAPKIAETSDKVQPQVGERLTIFCQASGRPRPTITWFSNREMRIDKTNTEAGSRFSIQERQSVVETELESYLVIAPILAGDRGSFMCLATNVAKSVHALVTVDVQQKPVMLFPTESSTLVYWWEGHKANVTCQTVGNPAPALIWTSFDETGNAHSMPLSPMVDVKKGIVVSSSIWLPVEKTFHLPAVFKCRAENRYDVTDVKQFYVKQGYAPLEPVVHLVSIKDDELVMSIDIPWHKDTPPVKYVIAHYHLKDALREMDESTEFTGNGTQLALRGIMLFYHYVIKVKAVNLVGESEETVFNVYAEEKQFTLPTTPSLLGENDLPNSTTPDAGAANTNNNNSNSNSSPETNDVDLGRSLQSQWNNNSSALSRQHWIIAVIFLWYSVSVSRLFIFR